MIKIDDKIISDDVVEVDFVCNLSACKGACCVEGDEGADLLEEEKEILEAIYPQVEPYLTEEGNAEIKKQGYYYKKPNGVFGAPIIDGKACVYLTYDEKNIALCGIEQAHLDGKIDFKKPLSCHLYPIRVEKYNEFQAVNYFKWDICSPACTLGKELQVPVYKFLKEPLERAFGEDFYEQLDQTAQYMKNKKSE